MMIDAIHKARFEGGRRPRTFVDEACGKCNPTFKHHHACKSRSSDGNDCAMIYLRTN